jgi:acetyl/propionyl-CoA carboxylase alpha subunit
MSDLEVRIGDEVVVPADGWSLVWDDARTGLARLVSADRSVPVVVEGSGTTWTVTLRGRRVGTTVRSWRERILAEAETKAGAHGGHTTVAATLPGLVVAVRVSPGDEVGAGEPLVTIEAMKMQNEVRSPRAARILEVHVAAGQAVATGTALVRLEETPLESADR